MVVRDVEVFGARDSLSPAHAEHVAQDDERMRADQHAADPKDRGQEFDDLGLGGADRVGAAGTSDRDQLCPRGRLSLFASLPFEWSGPAPTLYA